MAQEALLHFDIKRHIALCLEIRHCIMPLQAVLYFGKKKKRHCIVKHYTIMTLGRGEYPKLSTPLRILQRCVQDMIPRRNKKQKTKNTHITEQ